MSIVVLFMIANLWIQPSDSSMDKWIKTIQCMYTMEYYPVIKKNEVMSFAGKWKAK
jgi:hypothetical protein